MPGKGTAYIELRIDAFRNIGDVVFFGKFNQVPLFGKRIIGFRHFVTVF
jgi:hypothetical protein